DQIADLPAVPVHAIGPHRLLQQPRDQDAALVHAEALHVPGVRADVERLAPVARVGAHQGVAHRRIVAADLGADAGIDHAAGEAEAVHDDLAVQLATQVFRQVLVGHAHARELGLAPLGGNHARGQRGGVGGHRLEAAVAVPELVAGLVEHPAVLPAHQPALGVGVGEVHDVGPQTV